MSKWIVKLPIIAVAALAVACGGDDDEKKKNTGCETPDRSVATGGTAQCVDIGNFVAGTATCQADGAFDTSACQGAGADCTDASGATVVDGATTACSSVSATFESGDATCNNGSFDTSACVAGKIAEYYPCDPAGAADQCETGLTCHAVEGFNNPQFGVCGRACTGVGTQSTCDANELCDELLPGDPTTICMTTGARKDPCGIVLSEAAEPFGIACGAGLECASGVNFAFECKDVCEGADIGTATGCGGTDTCLGTGRLEGEFTEPTDGSEPTLVECTTPDTQDNCSDGFECRSIEIDDEGTMGNRCLKDIARCGAEADILTDFRTEDPSDPNTAVGLALIEGPTPADNPTSSDLCNYPNEDFYCAAELQAGATAEVECRGLGFAFVFQDGAGNAASCTSDIECPIEFGGRCLNFTDGAACGFLANGCVAFCETRDGSASLDCGAGYTCGAPLLDAGDVRFPVVERAAGARVTCDMNGDADCTTAEGYTCETFADGEFCARSRQVCNPT